MYSDEFYNCERPKARFHQYFIYGDYLDCNSLQEDKRNCKLWTKNKDIDALRKIIENEKKRKMDRLKAHAQNNVWVRRNNIPTNWNAPLPDWWKENNKNSYLETKSEAIKSGKVNDVDLHFYSACNIM